MVSGFLLSVNKALKIAVPVYCFLYAGFPAAYLEE